MSIQVPSCHNVFVVISFQTMHNKTIIWFGFCDILNNQGLGKRYQPRPTACWLITLTSTLIIADITKTSSNNCLLSCQLWWVSILEIIENLQFSQIIWVYYVLETIIQVQCNFNVYHTWDGVRKFPKCTWSVSPNFTNILTEGVNSCLNMCS